MLRSLLLAALLGAGIMAPSAPTPAEKGVAAMFGDLDKRGIARPNLIGYDSALFDRFGLDKPRVIALYDPAKDTIFFNPDAKIFKWEMTSHARYEYAIGYHASPAASEVLLHEMGHRAHFKADR